MLHVAAAVGNPAVVRLLIEHGADVAATTRDAETPLHVAAIYGFAPLVRLLLENGADISAKASEDLTPLHSAASDGKEAVVRLLLAKGADASAKSTEGKTPADLAAASSHHGIAKMLRARADPRTHAQSDLFSAAHGVAGARATRSSTAGGGWGESETSRAGVYQERRPHNAKVCHIQNTPCDLLREGGPQLLCGNWNWFPCLLFP